MKIAAHLCKSPVVSVLAFAAAGLFSMSAHAIQDCNQGTLTATYADLSTSSYVACTGAWQGNLNPTSATAVAGMIQAVFGLTSVPYIGKTGDLVDPFPFSNTFPASTFNSGVLMFPGVIAGSFVIGLHVGGPDVNFSPYVPAIGGGGGGFSLYQFNGDLNGGITQIAFNTVGVRVDGNGFGTTLSHAALYGGTVTAVPEPGSYALLLAGLGAIALVVRRRRPHD